MTEFKFPFPFYYLKANIELNLFTKILKKFLILKIISVLDARPQFVKSVILNDLLSKRSGIDNITIHTDQHFDDNMSSVFFDELLIKDPEYNLNINSLSHGDMNDFSFAIHDQ